jgi:uncharacterized YigZ family protein
LDTYLSINTSSEGIYKEKGSRFTAFAYPLSSVDEAKSLLLDLRKQYHDARHICYAYALGTEVVEIRANDDGEPSGTAGRPILGVIQSHRLTNVLIAVVRYFGGVKLGTSGLINAYREAAADALRNGEIVERIVTKEHTVEFDYPQVNEVMRAIKDENCEVIEQDFGLRCRLHFRIRKASEEQMLVRLQKIEGLRLG